jgi:hypothetical protein
LEKDVERFLVKGIEKLGGKCYKWVSPNENGVPDRIVLLPKGVIIFVELKNYNGRISQVQKIQHKIIENLGFQVYILNSKQRVHEFLVFCKELLA